MATITMKLNAGPFDAIINGTKTVEVRLLDDKRKKINLGDKIVFTKEPKNTECITCTVVNLYTCKTFKELYTKLGSDSFRNKTEAEFTKSIYSIYTKEQEQQYGVLGIGLKRLHSVMGQREKEITNELKQILTSVTDETTLRKAIIQHWKRIVKMDQDGLLDRETACYCIADVMFVPVIDSDDLLLDLALKAGALELPEKLISGNAEKRWQELQKVIVSLS